MKRALAPPALEIAGLAKSYGAVRALDGVSLAVGSGEFVIVLGPTGAGKTTLLRIVAGLERPDAGSIQIDGRDATELAPAERDVALVFQNFSLYPDRSVRENLAFPLRAPQRRLARAEIADRVARTAQILGIESLLDRSARQLSGGEMQRVAIGRAIVRRPKVFLMDEPLSNLDAKLREDLRVELRTLARELSTPVLWVTHDQAEALSMADRVAVLEAGKILQDATPPEVYLGPATPTVARLLGTPPMNILAARREKGWWVAADGTRIVEARSGASERATIGFRPEHVSALAKSDGAAAASVELVEVRGPAKVLLLSWAGAKIHVLSDRHTEIRIGERVQPRIDRDRVVVWT